MGLLRGARTGDPVTVPLLAEDREALWLADLAVGGRILARCGIVAVENPAGQLERSARMVSRRLEALVWERAATAWERNLDRIVKGSVDGEASEDAAFRCRLDLLARETVRALGCSGAGLYTWREAWSGYVLDGYFGPPMEQRPAIENPSRPAQSGWWFHAAGEPSLVRSASGVDTDDRTGTPILVWRSDTKGEAEANPSAIAEFERTYPDDALQAALAVKLRIPEDPLRPVLVVFGTQSSPWCDWIDRIHRAWHGV
ncbi:MAG TPA: hypothetical protein ENK19_06205, partial [Acidobacteria bacterium]|nr:hypothetical protein [Acidobacteriota bacterium]